ncbi:nitronate monooxygenase [Halobacillus salinarum]|uniref:Probable nitronate monooxygenase n=1 Tax=Halobacillus salinarum TaxID=2932257 RepID=A0ABY4EKL4_9BACI|nr:nitronate monooxygenase [Halobacillus salinarum]UOQ42611.1 nitronate monooxygenase [Halobacillus salinarum]
MWNENELTVKLGLSYPIIQAGMAGGVTTPELVAAVSNSGALGTLGAGYMDPDSLKESLEKIKQLTSSPFAVNVFVPGSPDSNLQEIQAASSKLEKYRSTLQIPEEPLPSEFTFPFEEQMKVIIESEVKICSFTFGIPPESVIHTCKEHQMMLIGTATTVEEAILNEKAGMDMVVMQGSEAGGHRGTFLNSADMSMVGTMALVPQAVDQVSIPVIAAGGIMDGRGILASLTLGAQAAQLGTAFLTTFESGAKKQHKEAVLKAQENDTLVTEVFSGKPARGIYNEFMEDLKSFSAIPSYPIQNTLTKSIRREAAAQNKPEWMSLWSGQGARLSRNVHAKELIESAVFEIDKLIQNW